MAPGPNRFHHAAAARLGVVTGMAAEARIAAEAGMAAPADIVCSGADPAQAGSQARALLDRGCTALLSFGIAGGLDPALRPGGLILAEAVILPDGSAIPTNAEWWAEVARRLGALAAAVGRVAGSDHAVTSPREKQALRAASGAAAVDMESHAVARVAAAAGVPLLVLRAIADPAGRGIPVLALAGIGADGRTRPGAVALGLLRRPGALPGLLRLARDSAAAMRTLRRAAPALRPPP